mgnify:FL=1
MGIEFCAVEVSKIAGVFAHLGGNSRTWLLALALLLARHGGHSLPKLSAKELFGLKSVNYR